MEGDFVKAGEHADLFFALRPPFLPVAIPHRPVTDAEREVVLTGMKSMYNGFVSEVAKYRRMTAEQVESLAQGRVWTGVEAKNNGLVDRIGGLHDAVMVARELAGIGPDEAVDVEEYGPKGLFRWNLPTPSISDPMAYGAITGGLDVLLARWLLGADTTERAPADGTYLDDYDLVYLRRIVQNNGRAQCMLPPGAIPHDGDRAVR
jgi:ClpP class serine protease